MFSCQKYELAEAEKDIPQVEISLKSGNSITENPDTVRTNVALVFYAKVNYGNIIEFSWNFGDNTGQFEGQQVVHKYEQEGNYTIELITYNGSTYDTIYLDLVVSNSTGNYYPIFSLKSAGNTPNAQGKLQYTLQFLRSFVPHPPVPLTGPYFYIGSNIESDWEEVTIYSDTSEIFAWYSIYSYDTVHAQAFGGWGNGAVGVNPVWGEMEDSEFYNQNFGYLKVGFQNSSLYNDNNFENYFPGSTGDDLPYPPVRLEVSEDSVTVFVDIRRQATEIIYWPKARFKYDEDASWSSLQDMTWVNGSGYAKVTLVRQENYTYFLRVWSKGTDSNTEMNLTGSSLWDEETSSIKFEILEL